MHMHILSMCMYIYTSYNLTIHGSMVSRTKMAGTKTNTKAVLVQINRRLNNSRVFLEDPGS